MIENILNKYDNNLDKIKDDKKELEKELRKVRSCYNAYHNFSSGFVVSFFLGFLGCLLKINYQDPVFKYVFIGAIFLIILVYQVIFVGVSNVYYEKMKIVEDKLGEINNAAQSKSNKVSVRVYNRNLVRHSNFIS